MKNLPHRDSVIWTAGIIGGACVALASHFTEFPWIPPNVQHAIELGAFLSSVFSAKMATSQAPEPPHA